jgi:hypothetical protein
VLLQAFIFLMLTLVYIGQAHEQLLNCPSDCLDEI